MSETKSALQFILENLKRHNQMPKRIDFSSIGDRYWCVVSDNSTEKDSIMYEDVYTGLSHNKEIALLKALSERTERYAFIEGAKRNDPSCLTDRSDGFAALPKSFAIDTLRLNALNEAVERFVWSTWWDDVSIKYEISEITINCEMTEKSDYLKTVFSDLSLECLKIIKPKVNSSDFDVQILIGKLKNKGFVSGGACGSTQDSENTFFRAIDELYRHGFAFKKAGEKHINATTSFYENRLLFFASGQGNSLVEDRLNQVGSKEIHLPDLVIDGLVDTRFEAYKVYRCYFKDQPPFVGGALERLCL